MKRKLAGIALCLLFAEGIIGCSVKAGSGDGSDLPTPPKQEFQDKIQGPSVIGSWASDCLYDASTRNYRIKSIQFNSPNFKRTSNTYQDSKCTKIADKDEVSGLYRWSNTTNYGGFVVDYKIDLGNGWTSETQEEVLIEDGKMYLSDFAVGFGFVSRLFPLEMQGAEHTTPNPQPTPNPTPAPQPSPKCPNINGTYLNQGSYTSLTQDACDKLIWQPLYSDFSPLGSADVYVMDGVAHEMGGTMIKSYYKGSLMVLEYQSGGQAYQMNFSLIKASTACGQSLGSEKTILNRQVFINGTEATYYCNYWEKVK